MLFSEPKIPQYFRERDGRTAESGFSALQRAENSSIFMVVIASPKLIDVSVLFSEPKIPQSKWRSASAFPARVSVLFSEPKIPQSRRRTIRRAACVRFSALQRAENSSITIRASGRRARGSFSALQRAENSSMRPRRQAMAIILLFQCSSASRKFLNTIHISSPTWPFVVSVLFSEPKIPQCRDDRNRRDRAGAFQCSSASRKFLNRLKQRRKRVHQMLFQCSSASRKFLNVAPGHFLNDQG